MHVDSQVRKTFLELKSAATGEETSCIFFYSGPEGEHVAVTAFHLQTSAYISGVSFVFSDRICILPPSFWGSSRLATCNQKGTLSGFA